MRLVIEPKHLLEVLDHKPRMLAELVTKLAHQHPTFKIDRRRVDRGLQKLCKQQTARYLHTKAEGGPGWVHQLAWEDARKRLAEAVKDCLG